MKNTLAVVLILTIIAAAIFALSISSVPVMSFGPCNSDIDRQLPNGYRIQVVDDSEMVVVGPDNLLVFPPGSTSQGTWGTEVFPRVAVVSHVVYAERVSGQSRNQVGYFLLDTISGSILVLSNLSDVERVLSQNGLQMGTLQPTSSLPQYLPKLSNIKR